MCVCVRARRQTHLSAHLERFAALYKRSARKIWAGRPDGILLPFPFMPTEFTAESRTHAYGLTLARTGLITCKYGHPKVIASPPVHCKASWEQLAEGSLSAPASGVALFTSATTNGVT